MAGPIRLVKTKIDEESRLLESVEETRRSVDIFGFLMLLT